MARKASGSEVKGTRSIRIEPKKLKKIAAKHGSLQKWFDQKVEQEIGLIDGQKAKNSKTALKLSAKEKAKFKKVVDGMF